MGFLENLFRGSNFYGGAPDFMSWVLVVQAQTHTCTCMHTQAPTCIYTQTCVCRHMHTGAHVCTHVHTQIPTHTHAHTDSHADTGAHICTHGHSTHVHIQTHPHTGECTHTHPHCTHRYSPCTYRHACPYIHRGRVGYSHLYSFVSICCFFRIVTTNFGLMFNLCPHSPHSYVLECFISPSSQHQRHWETTIKSDSSLSSWLHHASQHTSSSNP